MNFMVIDSDKKILNQFEKYFSSNEFDFCLSSSGEQALKKINENHYDVIFSNLTMPDLSSHDLIYHLINNNNLNAKIIIMSDLQDALYYINDKFNYYLTNTLHKPFKYKDIDEILMKMTIN